MDNNPQLQLNLITYGAVLGAILSLFTALVVFLLERKFSEKTRQKEKENEIIEQTLKFIFKANDILNDLWVDRELLEKTMVKSPQNAQRIEQQLFKRFDENIRNDFFKELMFHSGQIKRLKNKSFWEDFEKLNLIYQDLTKVMIDLKPKKEYEGLDNKYKELKKKFIEKCIKAIEI